MVSIYCIEDINDLKYIGSTKKKLNMRLSNHKSAKKINNYCSSSKLNLDNCKIYELEKCNEYDRKEREKYWINKIDCVNKMRYDFNIKEYRENNKEKLKEYQKEYHKEYQKEYRKNNKEKIKEYEKEYRKKNKEKRKEYSKEHDLFRRRSFVNACYEFIKMLEEY